MSTNDGDGGRTSNREIGGDGEATAEKTDSVLTLSKSRRPLPFSLLAEMGHCKGRKEGNKSHDMHLRIKFSLDNHTNQK